MRDPETRQYKGARRLMASKQTHRYATTVTWTGNLGQGTANYRSYQRHHTLSAPGKPPILGSSDPAFRGDPACWNPEELLVGSLSACHKLWYLHLCAVAGVVVVAYQDAAVGEMVEAVATGGHFTQVRLRPQVTITAASDPEKAAALHADAHAKCFIANSVNFPVTVEPTITIAASERP